MTEKSSNPREKHGARRNDAPVASGAARGTVAGPAKLTRKRFDEQQSGAPAVVARGGRRFALTAPSGWRHADTLGPRTSSRGPIAHSLQEAFSRDELTRDVWGYDPAAAAPSRTVDSTASAAQRASADRVAGFAFGYTRVRQATEQAKDPIDHRPALAQGMEGAGAISMPGFV